MLRWVIIAVSALFPAMGWHTRAEMGGIWCSAALRRVGLAYGLGKGRLPGGQGNPKMVRAPVTLIAVRS
jgi:hypothetical protein